VHNVNGTDEYAYDPANRRIWKRGVNGIEELHLYGIAGERLATYQLTYANPDWSVSLRTRNVYFAGRLVQMREGIYDKVVVTDRLGSVVATGRRYFPYGEEQVTTASDTEKFGTYYRDQRTNLDYADQRYYSSVYGRFLTADPSLGSASASQPSSWNRYAYVVGDPVNLSDPTGLGEEPDYCDVYPDDWLCSPLPQDLDPEIAPKQTIFTRHYELAKAKAAQVKKELNECERLAQFAEEAAKQQSHPGSLVSWFQALIPNNGGPQMQVLEALGYVTDTGMERYMGSWGTGTPENGFQNQYKDGAKAENTLGGTVWSGGNNDDQSHHFAIFLIIGYHRPRLATFANWLNDPPGGDRNLGDKAIEIGERLRQNKITSGDLGEVIRSEICK
jgi:RHS repeat-associated protein